jgi:hypothetical protein
MKHAAVIIARLSHGQIGFIEKKAKRNKRDSRSVLPKHLLFDGGYGTWTGNRLEHANFLAPL